MYVKHWKQVGPLPIFNLPVKLEIELTFNKDYFKLNCQIFFQILTLQNNIFIDIIAWY